MLEDLNIINTHVQIALLNKLIREKEYKFKRINRFELNDEIQKVIKALAYKFSQIVNFHGEGRECYHKFYTAALSNIMETTYVFVNFLSCKQKISKQVKKFY